MRTRRSPTRWLVLALLGSVALHVIGLFVADRSGWVGWYSLPNVQSHRPVQIVRVSDRDDRRPADATSKVDPPVAPEPPPLPDSGQIVEIAPPEDPERPEHAEYLAEYDQTVPEETRSLRYEVNPEVLANRWSPEQKIQVEGEDVVDLDMTRPSTGARVGAEKAFDPSRDGTLAATTSKWKVTNRDGLADPIPASALQSVLAGAPQNDRLREEAGAETALNTREFLYASYLLRIRRLVNFYWNQNLDNLPPSVRLSKPEYTTTVRAVLDGSGGLQTIEISEASGSSPLDDAVVRAFQVAGPYPHPPAGLIGADGRVLLPDMSFTVVLGVAQMRYEGVDPRAGVQFPGILKSPR